ncbi:bifunctional 23S rRNA (guanine(2069)-N(7))-methyltransferase RlmK/23S rRNA (guanine(2445)-N(2))-methyltransferase RlmL [Parashewanella spongiae]|uniref:Ribosomal RNA large subunit methyltransferase K/L n=1 Tax=Parashewanella spongiae TaxID=342950 RepID=A0A3A6U1G7_9GAMM|nr:bifunctional 23S rRNA (guanine(2069)-N(7))-methyltransferase RlmK/23S rRNA (guanine(2445)-N(2))-methyltransferase RlmL [Parashewanella spongiae]MCL1076881.1 bifunctional 23S rRNA (guanine(2069)-N(7))-methyltransferase RlmK/23S rRNA (guanine(2445)-N(2))-methyltransferase RlmL [Parashewanella spongiae]RJY19248.1 bifunctional 23S rRNA (guanine(2069)-N(7))-methyltransferase RlmK/23S rRNA (guanine(2445)-N(2))-methyltransferase RlmL [Parashewanella spongiae]
MFEFFAAAPRGFEYSLAQELDKLGASDIKESVAGVYFSASLELGYRITLWSRLASRIVLLLQKASCTTPDELYDTAYCIDWPSHFSNKSTFSIDFHGTGGFIKNTQFGALKIKDAVVDRFRDDGEARPNVERSEAEFRIDAHFRKGTISIGINFSGPGLHQRGYRSDTGSAPLKENLAANMLARSGWIEQQTDLFDPFCGSGTILIEAAMVAADIAPALHRQSFGFEKWRRHNSELWDSILQEAEARASLGKSRCEIKLFGSDIDPRVVNIAKQNAKNADVAQFIDFEIADALAMNPPFETGTLVSNPPYGERLGKVTGLLQLYYKLGEHFKFTFGGWKLALLCSEIELLSALKLKADRQLKMFNGAMECGFNLYTMHATSTRRERTETKVNDTAEVSIANVAPDFCNRIKKNLKQLNKWAKKEGIDSYRIYDADLPDYNVAIDKYLNHLVVQEYAAPIEIPESVTKRRISDILLVLPQLTDVAPNNIVVKTRSRQKGSNQYQKRNQDKVELITTEYNAKFKLNLSGYLDTGLFLDHRLTRRLVGDKSKNRHVLNLFAYTGTASVHAALGGAKSVTTVDMSHTYLLWAEENFKLNGIYGNQYHFEQADCLQWIKESEEQFDLIFIDPPTFSNSKRMEDSFEVERDHVELLTDLMKLLMPDGEIIFSNNKRKFKMDIEALAKIGIKVENLDAKTLPLDYKRNPQIHNTWLLTHG